MKILRNMKTRRWLFSPIVLFVWIIGGLLWSGMPVRAAAPVQAASVDSSLLINVSGTVTAPDGTKITVSGYVTVNSTAVPDITGALTSVVITFDCSNVTGTSGVGAKQVTYDTKAYRCTKIRPLQATDTISVVSPYFAGGSGVLSANSWMVTATLNFSVSTGQLASGSITVGNNTTTTNPTTGAVTVT